MPLLYEVMCPNGNYTDQNGQTKTRWLKCGAVVSTQAGKMALKLDAIPVAPAPNQNGDGGVWFQLFEPNQDKQNLHTASAPQQGTRNQQASNGFRVNPQQNQNTGGANQIQQPQNQMQQPQNQMQQPVQNPDFQDDIPW